MLACSRPDCSDLDASEDGVEHENKTVNVWCSVLHERRILCRYHLYGDSHVDVRCRVRDCDQPHLLHTLRQAVGARARCLLARPVAYNHAQIHSLKLPCPLPRCADADGLLQAGTLTLFGFNGPPVLQLLCGYHAFANPLVFQSLCHVPGCVQSRDVDHQHDASVPPRLTGAVQPDVDFKQTFAFLASLLHARAASLVLYLLAPSELEFRFTEDERPHPAHCHFQGCDLPTAVRTTGDQADAAVVLAHARRPQDVSHAQFHAEAGAHTACHFPFCAARGAALDLMLVPREAAFEAAGSFVLARLQRITHTCMFHLWCHPKEHPHKCVVADCLCPRSFGSVFCAPHLAYAARVAAADFADEAQRMWHKCHRAPVVIKPLRKSAIGHMNSVLQLSRMVLQQSPLAAFVTRYTMPVVAHTADDGTDPVLYQQEQDIERQRRQLPKTGAHEGMSVYRKTALASSSLCNMLGSSGFAQLELQQPAFVTLAPYLASSAMDRSYADIEQSRSSVVAQHSMQDFIKDPHLTLLSAGLLFYGWLGKNFVQLQARNIEPPCWSMTPDTPLQLLPLLFDQGDILHAQKLLSVYVCVMAKERRGRRVMLSCFPALHAIIHAKGEATELPAVPDASDMLRVLQDEDEEEVDMKTTDERTTAMELLCALLYYACYTRGKVAPYMFFASMMHAHLQSSRLRGLWNLANSHDSKRHLMEKIRSYVVVKVGSVRGCPGALAQFGHLFVAVTSRDMGKANWRWIAGLYTGEKAGLLSRLANVCISYDDMPKSQRKQDRQVPAAASAPLRWIDKWVPCLPVAGEADAHDKSPQQLALPVILALGASLRRLVRADEPLIGELLADADIRATDRIQSVSDWVLCILDSFYSPGGRTNAQIVRQFVETGEGEHENKKGMFDKSLCSSLGYLEALEPLNTCAAAAAGDTAKIERIRAVYRAAICAADTSKLPIALLMVLSECHKLQSPSSRIKPQQAMEAMSWFWTGHRTSVVATALTQKSKRLSSPIWKRILTHDFVRSLAHGT